MCGKIETLIRVCTCVSVRVIGFVVAVVCAASRRPRATPSLFNLFMLEAATVSASATTAAAACASAADSVSWVGTRALC